MRVSAAGLEDTQVCFLHTQQTDELRTVTVYFTEVGMEIPCLPALTNTNSTKTELATGQRGLELGPAARRVWLHSPTILQQILQVEASPIRNCSLLCLFKKTDIF